VCFTVNVNIVREELEERFGSELIDHDKYRPSFYYHAYSLPFLPVVCSPGTLDSSGSSGSSGLRLMRWGLIPSWVGDESEAKEIMLKTFNARSETIASKPAFRESFASRRCLVPVRGFFEWQHLGGRKIPWYITLRDEEIISLAGIWDSWTLQGGVTLDTFSVVTTRANELMEEIHNTKKRMPVILPRAAEKIWMREGVSSDALTELMEPVASEMLAAHTVSPLITNLRADRNRSELIMPYRYPVQGTLF
jgi:putative SOS response-associated peptidase YedK